jgi:hypothetical protein
MDGSISAPFMIATSLLMVLLTDLRRAAPARGDVESTLPGPLFPHRHPAGARLASLPKDVERRDQGIRVGRPGTPVSESPYPIVSGVLTCNRCFALARGEAGPTLPVPLPSHRRRAPSGPPRTVPAPAAAPTRGLSPPWSSLRDGLSFRLIGRFGGNMHLALRSHENRRAASKPPSWRAKGPVLPGLYFAPRNDAHDD